MPTEKKFARPSRAASAVSSTSQPWCVREGWDVACDKFQSQFSIPRNQPSPGGSGFSSRAHPLVLMHAL
jgi:hypothetical protein